jgi:hypothetical protein
VSELNPTPHLDDEGLSAVIDGAASPEGEQHARSCADCAASLAAWRRTLEALSVPAPVVDAARRDAAVAAALAGAATSGAASPVGPVSLADRRHRRRPGFLGSRVAAAAAAVIVVAGVAVGVWRAGGGASSHPPSAAKAATNVVPVAGGPGPNAGGAASSAAPIPGPGTAPPAPPGAGRDLGAYRDPGGLVAALRARVNLPTGTGGTPATIASGPSAARPLAVPCLTQATSDAKVTVGSPPVLAATLTYRGSPARVFVFQVSSGHTAAVVAVPGCRLLALAAF